MSQLESERNQVLADISQNLNRIANALESIVNATIKTPIQADQAQWLEIVAHTTNPLP